jgi:hypothetical protein
MSIREECPFIEELVEAELLEEGTPVWVDLPDRWLGEHQQRRDSALAESEKYKSPTLTRFAQSIACLDEWELPGMGGNPENWDFAKMDLHLIIWVIGVVEASYNQLYFIEKKLSPPSPNGATEEAETTTDGSSETTT